ncbi:MAG TPA: prepilin peptidase [Myxococcales bacterium]|nr:prepilin peptidase [Myxococcales bacterium]
MDEFFAAPLQGKIALAALLCALGVSVVTDLRRRRILNAVTYPALLVSAASVIWLGGLSLLAQSALGVLICAGPLAAASFRDWIGAGDVKLMAVAGVVSGAMAGWTFSLAILFWVVIAGGLQAALWLLAAWLRGKERPKSVPYGVAIAAGTLFGLFAGPSLF